MTPLEQLENKIRQSIPELKEEFEIFQEGAIDFDMITPIMLNHVLEYAQNFERESWSFAIDSDGVLFSISSSLKCSFPCPVKWNLKSAYLKHQSQELITFLNDLK